MIGVPEHFFISLIRFQPFDPKRHSTTFLSGKEPTTQKGLLITMGIFMSLAIVGMIAEVAFRMARKAKIQNHEGIYIEQQELTKETLSGVLLMFIHYLKFRSILFGTNFENLAETYPK